MVTFWSVLLAAFLLPAAPHYTPPDSRVVAIAPADTTSLSEKVVLGLKNLRKTPTAEKIHSLLSRFLEDDCQWDEMDPGMVIEPDTTAETLIGRVLPSRSVMPRGHVLSPCPEISERRYAP